VYVWQLRRDKSEQAAKLRSYLMKLSGRQTKWGVESTASALLAGWYTMVAMLTLLEGGISTDELRQLVKNTAPPGFFV
jgi:hypothetical protein